MIKNEKNILSTGDVNFAIRKIGCKEIVSVDKLKSMGFIPAFETKTGTYWDEEIVGIVIDKLNLAESIITKSKNNRSNIAFRDYIAGQALSAFLNQDDIRHDLNVKNLTMRDICRECYEWADVMIQESQQ
jgi:hypothetical protein